jgi:hypothetical protein
MPRYTLPVKVVSPKKGPCALFAEGANHVHLWPVMNMFQGDTWTFAAPDPAVVGADLTTDMKRAHHISGFFSYGDSLTVAIPGKTQYVLLYYDSSRHCTCSLNKFI